MFSSDIPAMFDGLSPIWIIVRSGLFGIQNAAT
jgi:hypothetical protein